MAYYYKKRYLQQNISINLLLIIANVALFIIFSILLYVNEKAIDFIALKPANIFYDGYLWTFLTSMFMHGNVWHLLVNMLTLMFIGGLVEKIIGYKRYFLFYMISGIFAGVFFVLLSLIFPADFNAYAVGASGAVFGLIGLLMIMTPNLPVYIMFIPIPIKMKYAAPGILIVLWMISVAADIPIGNTAHLGGLIAGLAYGVYLREKYKNKMRYIREYFS